MANLYVTSTEAFSGKSATCVGLGLRFRRDGLKVGYMKPVNVAALPGPEGPQDDDVAFIKEAFELPEPLDVLGPVALTPSRMERLLRGQDTTDYEALLRSAYDRVHKDRDVIILEGGTTLREGYLINLPTPRVAEMLDARPLVVIRWDESRMIDDALASRTRLGEPMIGIILNMVPQNKMGYAEDVIRPFLERHGIPVFGILPQDRLLQAASVTELAEGLDANILTCSGSCDVLVENVVVGAMNVDSALSYFRRTPNKAVITGGDRADIQLAALETSTRCLILTGNIMPNPMILTRAEEAGVPVLLCHQDTLTTVEIVEGYFGRSRFQQRPKIERFTHLLEKHMDFARLYQALGLRSMG
ncbi:MAG: phosphotransacetylase family protein [Anaerolineae bacterium]|nr:phosphotransacetylase family protein [Anaerolineae bacterium]MDW8099611.1 phosphotransacetylase family protein [Anaerolineae bacterium]